MRLIILFGIILLDVFSISNAGSLDAIEELEGKLVMSSHPALEKAFLKVERVHSICYKYEEKYHESL